MTKDEILLLLIEECGETIQAATKILRFGWDAEYKNYGDNTMLLSGEIGDVLGCIDELYSELYPDMVNNRRKNKINRVKSYLRKAQ